MHLHVGPCGIFRVENPIPVCGNKILHVTRFDIIIGIYK